MQHEPRSPTIADFLSFANQDDTLARLVSYGINFCDNVLVQKNVFH